MVQGTPHLVRMTLGFSYDIIIGNYECSVIAAQSPQTADLQLSLKHDHLPRVLQQAASSIGSLYNIILSILFGFSNAAAYKVLDFLIFKHRSTQYDGCPLF